MECTHSWHCFFVSIQFSLYWIQDPSSQVFREEKKKWNSSLFFPCRMSISCSIWSCIHKRYDWQLCASNMYHFDCMPFLYEKRNFFNLTFLEAFGYPYSKKISYSTEKYSFELWLRLYEKWWLSNHFIMSHKKKGKKKKSQKDVKLSLPDKLIKKEWKFKWRMDISYTNQI